MSAQFDFQYDYGDMLAATWLSMRKRWFWKKSATYIVLLTVILVAAQLIANDHSAYQIMADILTATKSVAVGVILSILYLLWYIPRRVRKTYAQLQLDGQHVHVECDDDEIRIQDSSGFAKLAWPRLIKWTENSRFLLLYRTDLQCYYLPKDKVDAGILETVKANLAKANVPVF